MKGGKWIPLCKALVSELPRDGRPFTKLEAMFSLTLDYDNGNPVTLRGYARSWRWSTGKVERFLNEIGVEIHYPKSTGDLTNQRGTIVSTNPRQSRDSSGTINFIDSKPLPETAKQQRDINGTEARQSRVTTIDPDPEPEIKPSFPSDVGRKETTNPKPAPVISEAVMKISEKLASLILENNPKNRELQDTKREATVLRWAKDIDKMIRIDGRDAREVWSVVVWCQRHAFWSQNILSGSKLREQYDQLVVRMKPTSPALHGLGDIDHHAGITAEGRF